MKLILALFSSFVAARPRRLFDDRQFVAEPIVEIVDDPADDFLEYLFARSETNEPFYQSKNAVETVYRPEDLDFIFRGNDFETNNQPLRKLNNYGYENRERKRRFRNRISEIDDFRRYN